MNFKYKCFLQVLFSRLYKGEVLNYFFQRYVTKSLPISELFFKQRVFYSYNLFLKFQKYNLLSENTKRYYEFGAGWDLLTPLSMSALGFNVSCIDIRRLVFKDLIIDSLHRLDNFTGNDNIRKLFQVFGYRSGDVLEFLEQSKNFHYYAPRDARDTGFERNYFDFISSTEVFEHVPEKDLCNILFETYNILKPGGVFIDHMNIIKKTPFDIVDVELNLPNKDEIDSLKLLNISDKFKKYSIDDLGIKSSIIVLRKPNM